MLGFLEHLFEYREEASGTFEDNGKKYKINKIFAITDNKPTQKFRISELRWIYKSDPNAFDFERIKNADLSFPIIVTKEGDKLVIVDGLHRTIKADREGREFIEGHLITREELETTLIKEYYSIPLEYHAELNPKLWNDWKLDPAVREHLLEIAAAWAEFANIKDEYIVNVVATGGNCNFNYSSFSDIDVHLIVRMDKISTDQEMLSDYLYSKKLLWSLEYSDLKVKGYPVELYAQDKNIYLPKDQGVFSLLHDAWISKPTHLDTVDLKDPLVRAKLGYYIKRIRDILKSDLDMTDEIKQLKEKLFQMRKDGLAASGEFSEGNLLYKSLRNLGYLDQLNKYLERKKIAKFALD